MEPSHRMDLAEAAVMHVGFRQIGTNSWSNLTHTCLEVRGPRRQNLKLAWEDAWNHTRVVELTIVAVGNRSTHSRA